MTKILIYALGFWSDNQASMQNTCKLSYPNIKAYVHVHVQSKVQPPIKFQILKCSTTTTQATDFRTTKVATSDSSISEL